VTAGTIFKLRGSAFALAPARVAAQPALTEIELVPAPIAAAVSPEPDDSGAAVSPSPAVPRPATPVQHRASGETRARAQASGPSTAAAAPLRPVASNPTPAQDKAAPARFALALGTIGNVAAVAGPTGGGPGAGPSPSSAPTHSADAGGVVPEGEVSMRARLVASSPLLYPPAARRAEMEADLALEIIVDLEGRVVSARVLRPAGYGLDEEALRAVRSYRFSPARRDDRPVRVRMPWTVQFRLR